jgi:signal transduction histidine kinase
MDHQHRGQEQRSSVPHRADDGAPGTPVPAPACTRQALALHDAVSQTLFAAHVVAGTLAQQAAQGHEIDRATLAHQARALERLNRGALAELRMLWFELQPDALGAQPLSMLLRSPIDALACRGDTAVHATLEGGDALAAPVRQALYRMARELLSNLARHSEARNAWVDWSPAAPGGATLQVRDDGQGFDPAAPDTTWLGLDTVRQCARQIGARVDLSTAPGQGTTVTVTVAPATTPSTYPVPATSDAPAQP